MRSIPRTPLSLARAGERRSLRLWVSGALLAGLALTPRIALGNDNPCSPTPNKRAPTPTDEPKAAGPDSEDLPWNPDALRPVATGASLYQEAMGGAAGGDVALDPTRQGKQVAWIHETYKATYVMAGAFGASGYDDWLGTAGLTVDLRFIVVTTSRYLLGLAGTYLRPFDRDRRALGFELTLGYGVWGAVHGDVLGYYETSDAKAHLVRNTRSAVFVTAGWGTKDFGRDKDDKGHAVFGPQTMMLLYSGLTGDFRMRRMTVTLEASAVYTVNRERWGARARALIAVRRYTAALSAMRIDDYADQVRLTVGREF